MTQGPHPWVTENPVFPGGMAAPSDPDALAAMESLLRTLPEDYSEVVSWRELFFREFGPQPHPPLPTMHGSVR